MHEQNRDWTLPPTLQVIHTPVFVLCPK